MKQQSLLVLVTYLLKCHASSIENESSDHEIVPVSDQVEVKSDVSEKPSNNWSLFGWWSSPSSTETSSSVIEEKTEEVKVEEVSIVEANEVEITQVVQEEPKKDEESVTKTEVSSPSSWLSPSYWFGGNSNNVIKQNEAFSVSEQKGEESVAKIIVNEIISEKKEEALVEETQDAVLLSRDEEKQELMENSSTQPDNVVTDSKDEGESVSYFWRLLGYGGSNKDAPSRIPQEVLNSKEEVVVPEEHIIEEKIDHETAPLENKIVNEEADDTKMKVIEINELSAKSIDHDDGESLPETEVLVNMPLVLSDKVSHSESDEEPTPHFVPIDKEADPTLRYLFDGHRDGSSESYSQEEIEIRGLFDDLPTDSAINVRSRPLEMLELPDLYDAMKILFGSDSEDLELDFLFDSSENVTNVERTDSDDSVEEQDVLFEVSSRFLSHNPFSVLRNHHLI